MNLKEKYNLFNISCENNLPPACLLRGNSPGIESSNMLFNCDFNNLQMKFGNSLNTERLSNSQFKSIIPRSFTDNQSQQKYEYNFPNNSFNPGTYFSNQTLLPINKYVDNSPMFVNPKQYETILMMRFKKMKRSGNGYYLNHKFRSKKKVKYESRSRHAKKRKRAKDGKFLPNTTENCTDNLSSSTILKETLKGDSISRSRSRSRDREDRLLETDSINGRLSPHDLQRKPAVLSLARNTSSDIFRSHEHNSLMDNMLFDQHKNKEKSLNSFKWNAIDKGLPIEEPKLFHKDSLKTLNN